MSIVSKFFSKKNQKNSPPAPTGDDSGFIDPLEPILQSLKEKYPVKNYILQEDISTQLAPQAEIIHASMQNPETFSAIFYSYITFHQKYFHLKNYLLQLKKKMTGYHNNFLDIFYDNFLDNFIVFREMSKYLDEKQIKFLNIWLDGYFVNSFSKIMDKTTQRYKRIQPELFFIIILFMALPEISNTFEEVHFTSILKFHKGTGEDWKKALAYLKELDFQYPLNVYSINHINSFLLTFMNMNISVDEKGNEFIDEMNTFKCINFLNTLNEKTDDMITSIKKVRNNMNNVNL